MTSFTGRAVVAAAFPPEAERLRAMLSAVGFSGITCVHDGLAALDAVRSEQTDVLVADAVLPVIDGAALVGRIRQTPLAVYPAMALLTAPGMRLGVPENGGSCAVLEKPVSAAQLADALAGEAPHRRRVEPERQARVMELLDSLGVPEHPGRRCLARAILIAREDTRVLSSLAKRLYPYAAEEGMTPRRAERAMRHVIDIAWKRGEIGAQYAIFGDTIDAGRGSPTLGEMIAQIADILRWEGKA